MVVWHTAPTRHAHTHTARTHVHTHTHTAYARPHDTHTTRAHTHTRTHTRARRYERSSGALFGKALVQRHVALPEDMANKARF